MINTIQNQCRRVYKHHKFATSSSIEKTMAGSNQVGHVQLHLDNGQVESSAEEKTNPLAGGPISNLSDNMAKEPSLHWPTKHAPKNPMQQQAQQQPNKPDSSNKSASTTPHHKQFITDLIMQIKLQTQGKEILIGMDANEDVTSPKSKISCIFKETDLVDLHYCRHPATCKPATHQRGSTPIDMLLGTAFLPWPSQQHGYSHLENCPLPQVTTIYWVPTSTQESSLEVHWHTLP